MPEIFVRNIGFFGDYFAGDVIVLLPSVDGEGEEAHFKVCIKALWNECFDEIERQMIAKAIAMADASKVALS